MNAMPDIRRTPDSHDRDPDPDRAALDELRQAFGVEPTAAADDDGDSTAAASSEPIEFEIVEQEPPPAPEPDAEPEPEPGAEPEPEPEPDIDPDIGPDIDPDIDIDRDIGRAPAIIRIDDLGIDDPGIDEVRIDDLLRTDTVVDPVETHGERQLISIDADDLPDAVYVEGSLDAGASTTIVFIEDAPDSELLTPESDRDLRRGIEPRMRERRLAVKRAQGRKRLKWAVAIVVVLLIGVGALATLGSSLFAVRAGEVSITGNVYTDPERLQAIVDDLVGTPVLRVDTQAAEDDLEAIPWVESAKVTTDFPHAVSIDISERRAVATYQAPDGRFRVLDPEGRVLDVIDKWPFAYVVVSGPDSVDLEAGDFAPQGYKAAAELADNLTGSVRGSVDRIEVTANGSRLSLWLVDGTEVRFGEARDLFVKLVRLETVLSVNPERVPGRPIDVSTDETTSPTPTVTG
jgi:cell division protein FtsQ